MTPASHTSAPRATWWPRLARAVWIGLAFASLVCLVTAVPARFQQLVTVTPTPNVSAGQLTLVDRAALLQLGLMLQGYALLFEGLEIVAALVMFCLGVFMFARVGNSIEPYLLSLALVTFGLITSPLTTPLDEAGPPLGILLPLLRAVGLAAVVVSLLIFPDGHFVPRWTRWFAAAWVAYVAVTVFVPSLRLKASLVFESDLQAAQSGWALLSLVVVACVQIYRYRTVATPIQQLQTRWVVFGLAAMVAIIGIAVLPITLLTLMDSPRPIVLAARLIVFTAILVAYAFFGVCLAVAILRHRLFDIGVIIRRTLVYGVLTALLALLFFGVATAMQQVFVRVTGQRSDIAIVASNLLIATLALPLRNRIQAVIDRRFYRRKYDVQKTLEAFAARLQSQGETDVNGMADEVTGVIQETLQPSSVKVWLVESNDARSTSEAPGI